MGPGVPWARARRLARDVSLNVLGRNGQFLVTFLTIPVIARTLGPDGFGLYALGTAAYFYGSALVDGGLTMPLAARAAADPGPGLPPLRRTYDRLRALLFLAVLCSGLLAVVFPPWFYVWLGLCAGACSSLGEEWLLLGGGRFATILVVQWCGRAVFLGLLLALLPRWPHAAVPLLCLGAGACASTAVSRLVARGAWLSASGPPTAPGNDSGGGRAPTEAAAPADGVAGLLRFAWAAMLSRLVASAYTQSSPLLMSARLSTGELGAYAATDRVVRAGQAVLDTVVISAIPRMARRRARGEVTTRTVWELSLTGLALGSLAAVCLYPAAPAVVAVLYGEGFGGVVPALRLAGLLLPLGCATSMVASTVIMVGQRPRLLLAVHVVGLAVTMLVLLAQGQPVDALGAVGAAVAGEAAAMMLAVTLALVAVRTDDAGRDDRSTAAAPPTEFPRRPKGSEQHVG